MELKNYQKCAISDLKSYLDYLGRTDDVKTAYNEFWEAKEINVGLGGVPVYNSTIKGVPQLCFKVPTGGGKTLMACASIKAIFSKLDYRKEKVVVWLVPSDAILEQTVRNLKNTDHPYRQKIDSDFGGRVEIYTKQELLNGQNFNPSVVRENLCIMVLSFDSLRITKKEGRKVYQQNGNLDSFSRVYADYPNMIEDADATALIQIINKLRPVVIVDESHNATSELSVEMLNNLNPSITLDLTATPRKNSNIITYVDAMQLKRNNMVKLPVIVYNNKSTQEVMERTIELRANLEVAAIEDEKVTGNYIRPIVLFQAQPKTNENAENYEKMREKLIKANIPKEQIAIKVSGLDELKGIDLLSRDCPIRYIITVNALKEGWDCPFAYILASLANRTSKVDVEQILGRILRQPNTKLAKSNLLNMSYVLTSSDNFRETISSVVDGLNNSGFSKDDFRAKDAPVEVVPQPKHEQMLVDDTQHAVNDGAADEDFLDFDPSALQAVVETAGSKPDVSVSISQGVADIIQQAEHVGNEYNQAIENAFKEGGDGETPKPAIVVNNNYRIKGEYSDSVTDIRLPQFFSKEDTGSFFDGEDILFKREYLLGGFTLSDKDSNVNFESVAIDVKKVDLERTDRGVQPVASKMTSHEQELFRRQIELSCKTLQSLMDTAINTMYNLLNRMDEIHSTELKAYIKRVLSDKDGDMLKLIVTNPNSSAAKIKEKIKSLENDYITQQFYELIETEEISLQDSWQFPKDVFFKTTVGHIPKALYEEEDGGMNNLEYNIITAVADCDNVVWWHRNPENSGFCINGNINHYPDFIVKLESGKIVLIETKGNQLENTDSKIKVQLGKKWQALAGNKFKYYMVFMTDADLIPEAVRFDNFITTLKKL